MQITLDHITKRFGAVTALDDLCCEIADGELFFLLGPSGCGKTTLLRILAGFAQPDAGRLLFDGENAVDTPPHRRPTAMVFQGYALWPHMTVEQNVAFGLEMRKEPPPARLEQVRKALEQVHIADLADRRPNELSGGQQQRVALARTLAVGPKCLLLDEPLANLDAKLRIEMRVEIRRLCKANGLTAIYVTHDQKEALSMADRLAVMNRGRILQMGTPATVYRRPVNAFVAEFVGETNFIEGRVKAVENGMTMLESAAGPIRALVPEEPISAGREVTLSIRPEALRILADSRGDEPNAFSCVLVEAAYLGDSARYRFKVNDKIELAATEFNPRELREPNQECRIAVDPHDVRVLPQARRRETASA